MLVVGNAVVLNEVFQEGDAQCSKVIFTCLLSDLDVAMGVRIRVSGGDDLQIRGDRHLIVIIVKLKPEGLEIINVFLLAFLHLVHSDINIKFTTWTNQW